MTDKTKEKTNATKEEKKEEINKKQSNVKESKATKEEPAKKGEKPESAKKKGEKKEKLPIGEIHTINLSKAYNKSRKRRIKGVIQVIRDYVAKHKRKEAVITRELNSIILERSIEKPPRKMKVRLVVKEKVYVYPVQ